MTMIFGVPVQALMGQLLVGLINGSFYALLSLGLAPAAARAPQPEHSFRASCAT